MVLDELHGLVEVLQGRIEAHADSLQKSEALTRYALIDPLLRGLGWDTGDPGLMRVEHPLPKGAQKGFADYALLRNGSPHVIIEAKSLNTQLRDAAMQALSYCTALGFPYFAVTDGQRWELYETFRPVALPQKLVMELDLNASAARTCLDALALWRPSVVGGHIQAGAAPVIGHTGSVKPSTDPREPWPKPPTPNGTWHKLSDFQPVPGSKLDATRLSDGTVIKTPKWSDLTAEIVKWLKVKGYLNDHNLPIQIGKSNKVFLINTEPRNPTGKQFNTYRQIDSWFVNTNYNATQHVWNVRGVIQLAQLDPADFAVRLQE